jgi:hypothetical protein
MENPKKKHSPVILSFTETTPEKAQTEQFFCYNNDLYILLENRFPKCELLFQLSNNPDYARILSARTGAFLGYAQRVAKNVPPAFYWRRHGRIYSMEDYL